MKLKYEKYNVGASIARPYLTKQYLNRNIKNQKLKINENGITIISLIITIVLMLILATVVINVGTGELDESTRVSFVSYMQLIQTKVDLMSEIGNFETYGAEMPEHEQTVLQDILKKEQITSKVTDFKYFDSNTISSQLEIDNIEDEIAVNFKTREVISLNGVEYEGQMYYTQYKLPGGQSLKYKTEEVARNLSIGSITSNIDGLNATFTIKNIGLTNGTLSYGRMDTSNEIKWTTITNYTKSGESITTKNITESGTYYFKLVDNITGEENIDENGNYFSVELRLTNKPKLEGNLTELSTSYNYSDLDDSTKWAFATDSTDAANVKYYVWIPRFVYKLNASKELEELQFLRGNSDVTTSGGYINDTEWTVPEAFTKEEVQKTGVWVQVTSKESIIDIIDILKTGTVL